MPMAVMVMATEDQPQRDRPMELQHPHALQTEHPDRTVLPTVLPHPRVRQTELGDRTDLRHLPDLPTHLQHRIVHPPATGAAVGDLAVAVAVAMVVAAGEAEE